MRFPGGCYIEGDWLRNAFRWKDSIGGWEERPGHLNGEQMAWGVRQSWRCRCREWLEGQHRQVGSGRAT